MSGIINSVKSFFASDAPAAPPAVLTPAARPEQPLYFRDEKGRLSCNIEKLTDRQCEVIKAEFNGIARSETTKAIAIALTGGLVAVGLVIAAIAAAKIAGILFIVCIGNTGLVASIGEVSIIAIKAAIHGVIYLTAGLGLWKLWNESQLSVETHWNYATHIHDTAVKASLRQATFDKPVQPIAAPVAATAVREAAPAPVIPQANG